MKIVNIEMRHNPQNPNERWIYANLVNSQGELVISATLDYILQAAHERQYKVENIGDFNCQPRRQRGLVNANSFADKEELCFKKIVPRK